MDNERNFPIRSRVAGGARGRSFMDSFLFHPTRASFHQSASIGRGISSSFPSLPSPSFQPNSSILTSLLHSDVPSFSSNQPLWGSSSNLMTAPDFTGSVQDLSSSPHSMVSSMEAPNPLRGWMEPSNYQNPPMLSPIQPNPLSSLFLHENPPDLSPIHENPLSSPFRQQIPPNRPLPQQNPSFFHPFIPPALTGLQRFCADFSFPAGCSDTFSGQLFNLASSTVFLGNDMGVQLCFAINRYLMWFLINVNIPLGVLLSFSVGY